MFAAKCGSSMSSVFRISLRYSLRLFDTSRTVRKQSQLHEQVERAIAEDFEKRVIDKDRLVREAAADRPVVAVRHCSNRSRNSGTSITKSQSIVST